MKIKMLKKIPGRSVGQTIDNLTLNTRMVWEPKNKKDYYMHGFRVKELLHYKLAEKVD